MSDLYLRTGRPISGRTVLQTRLAVLVIAAALLTLGGILVAGLVREPIKGSVATTNGNETPPLVTTAVPATTVPGGEEVAVPAGAEVAPESVPAYDNAVAASDEPDGCRLSVRSMGIGKTGADVECLQKALLDAGYFSGTVNALYDNATADAVRSLQEDRNLFVDGVAGRETGLSLGIWPDEDSLVVRTPEPAEGAVDLSGYELSPVAISGDDPNLPPLPSGSGSGRRVVYDRAGQRAWAINEDDQIIRSWLVSGSQYDNEVPGTHEVFSRSEQSSAWNGKAILPLMIRWYPTDIGNLGFHGIPIRVSDGSVYQTTDELGTRLSGGCQRQHNIDAAFMWEFAHVGTTVVVT